MSNSAVPIVASLTGNEPIALLLPNGNQAFTTPDQIAAHGAGDAPVQSVNGDTGVVVLDATDIAGVVDLTTAQEISGVKTFSASPIVPVPSGGTDVANKNYVDAQITIVNQTLDVRMSSAARTAVNAVAAIATADATDPATTMALTNECKAKINSLIAALKAA